MVFRERQAQVDEQIAEVDKLNAIINSCEKEMLRLKKQYELVIEARNYTGTGESRGGGEGAGGEQRTSKARMKR